MKLAERTPREWLITFAVGELQRCIHDGTAPADRRSAARLAMEIVVNGNWLPGTLGRAMYNYYLDASETARERLDATIARKAG